MAKDRCKHAGCSCEARADGFCSDACKDNRQSTGRCGCGHSGCK